MGKVILGLTMSLDGYINDQNGSVERLYPDLDELRNTEPLRESINKHRRSGHGQTSLCHWRPGLVCR